MGGGLPAKRVTRWSQFAAFLVTHWLLPPLAESARKVDSSQGQPD